MSCLVKIRSIRDDMSANEKKLADYILDNSALLRDYSSLQLAKAVGVSQSSVVKFCQKMGYRGYPDLKLAINEAVIKSSTEKNITPKYFSNSELNSVSEKLLQSKLEAVTVTIELNTEIAFIAASKAIKKAQKIQILGGGIAGLTAEYFAISLIYMGKVAYASMDKIYQQQFLNSLDTNDVLILLSAITELDINKLELSALRSKGVQIIQICPYSANVSTHVSDIELSTVSENEKEASAFPISRRAAQQHIIDILLSLSNGSGSSSASGSGNGNGA